MPTNKEEKTQAEKFKAQALSNAKGLSRAQAERAAAAAARNVNAYGQKEEGPSRWQERKEAKRQMYLMSTEKAVRLGERKDLKASSSTMGGAVSQCQKCFQTGHWTYECKNERVYISRPSRSQQLKNPKLRQKLMASYNLDNPDIKKEENGEEKKSGKKSKRKHRSDTESGGSDSEASVFDSESGSSSASASEYSSESGSSYSSSSDSEEERRRRKQRKKQRKKRKQRKGKSRRRRYTSSSSEEDSDSGMSSDSFSDSDDDPRSSRKKSKRHSRRR